MPRIVLLTRPGNLEKLNNQLASTRIGPLDASQTVEIGPLGWRSMAAMLKAKPLGIDSPEQRGAIVSLAEGNPQVAVIAARVATERRSVVGLSGDQLLQRYIAYLIPTAIPSGSDVRRQRKLLALLAALDGSSMTTRTLSVRWPRCSASPPRRFSTASNSSPRAAS